MKLKEKNKPIQLFSLSIENEIAVVSGNEFLSVLFSSKMLNFIATSLSETKKVNSYLSNCK